MTADLREHLFGLTPEELKLAPSEKRPHVWAALMDMAISNRVATVVAVADGTVSLYTSAGGGVIGAGEHVPVRQAASHFLDVAEAHLAELSSVGEHPLPVAGHVKLYALTYNGVFAADAETSEVRRGHPLYDLFSAAQAVITAMREMMPDNPRTLRPPAHDA